MRSAAETTWSASIRSKIRELKDLLYKNRLIVLKDQAGSDQEYPRAVLANHHHLGRWQISRGD
jgi:alpha-ketoglutarate-dependent taurine dioxygenase